MNMKIIFIINSMVCGGAQKIISILSEHLSDDNEIHLLVLQDVDIVTPIPQNVKLHIIKSPKIRFIRAIVQFFRMLVFARSERPHILVSFLTRSNAYAVLTGKLLGVPVIAAERGDPERGKKNDPFLYWIINHADGMVFQTSGAARFFSQRLQEIGQVIPNPISDSNLIYDIKSRIKYKISCVSRFEIIQKRQDVMINAFAHLVRKYEAATLHFYGDGPDMCKAKEQIQLLNLSDKVYFHGYVSNVAECVLNSHLYVLSSDYEGIPNSLIEALSIGIPCISTDCRPGGAKLLMEKIGAGILVPRGDAEAMAGAVDRLFQDDALCEQFSKNGRNVSKIFSIDNIVAQWRDYIYATFKNYNKQ